MFDLIIRRARLTDETLTDIAVKDGRIAAVGTVSGTAKMERDLAGRCYLSAGWIDTHVHCYEKSPLCFDQPDRIGVATGVTTVIDAGSTGADDIDEFRAIACRASTRVYALLNVSRIGLVVQHELADMNHIDKAAARAAVQRLPDFIVGLKARISSSVVGNNGIQPLMWAQEIQRENGGLPLMVHIGSGPPDVAEIAGLLTSGDIITHCYNGKPNRILTRVGQLRAAVKMAIERGVRLDVGHGSASFSFEVARAAIAQGVLPHSISSDIYCRNRINGPVHSLAHVMSKFFNVGMTLPQIIDCVTWQAAQGLRLKQKGRLEPGYDADFTLFTLTQRSRALVDAAGVSETGEQHFTPLAAVVAGEWLLTDEGRASHVFGL